MRWKEDSGRRASAARLAACLEASGAQTEPRNARINVKRVDHGKPNIAIGSSRGYCGETAHCRSLAEAVLWREPGRMAS